MTQVLTLTGLTPPERYDDHAWTAARIEEATTETGSYTLLETVDLDPVDDDPATPRTRSFTTELATAGRWYRVVFVDETGDRSTASAPVLASTGVTAAFASRAELARLLKIDATTYQTQLDEVLLAAAWEIRTEIGHDDLNSAEAALASQVNIERATEHWHQRQVSFGILDLTSEGPVRLARDTWERHAIKLAPLKESWGIA